MNGGGLQPVGETYIPTSGPTRSRARAIWDEVKRSVWAREAAQRTAHVDAATITVHPASSVVGYDGGIIIHPFPRGALTRDIEADLERVRVRLGAEARMKHARRAARAGMRRSMPEATEAINRGRRS